MADDRGGFWGDDGNYYCYLDPRVSAGVHYHTLTGMVSPYGLQAAHPNGAYFQYVTQQGAHPYPMYPGMPPQYVPQEGSLAADNYPFLGNFVGVDAIYPTILGIPRAEAFVASQSREEPVLASSLTLEQIASFEKDALSRLSDIKRRILEHVREQGFDIEKHGSDCAVDICALRYVNYDQWAIDIYLCGEKWRLCVGLRSLVTGHIIPQVPQLTLENFLGVHNQKRPAGLGNEYKSCMNNISLEASNLLSASGYPVDLCWNDQCEKQTQWHFAFYGHSPTEFLHIRHVYCDAHKNKRCDGNSVRLRLLLGSPARNSDDFPSKEDWEREVDKLQQQLKNIDLRNKEKIVDFLRSKRVCIGQTHSTCSAPCVKKDCLGKSAAIHFAARVEPNDTCIFMRWKKCQECEESYNPPPTHAVNAFLDSHLQQGTFENPNAIMRDVGAICANWVRERENITQIVSALLAKIGWEYNTCAKQACPNSTKWVVSLGMGGFLKLLNAYCPSHLQNKPEQKNPDRSLAVKDIYSMAVPE